MFVVQGVFKKTVESRLYVGKVCLFVQGVFKKTVESRFMLVRYVCLYRVSLGKL